METLVEPQAFDDALPEELMEVLSHISTRLPSQTTSYWSTAEKWSPPIMEECLASLIKLTPLKSLGDLLPGGVEWWIRRTPGFKFQCWHVDKDEALFFHTKEFRTPRFGSVLYLSDQGGDTIISSQRACIGGTALEPVSLREAWTVSPRRNRFVIFPGDAVHAVLPGCSFEARVSMPINWWDYDVKTVQRERLAQEPPEYMYDARAGWGSPSSHRAHQISLPRWTDVDLPMPVRQRWPNW